jgi:non-ribosomal peptide synthetase component E (peptide arylation enzyme)
VRPGRSRVRPGRSTTNAHTRSPSRSSGTPTTATSATAGCLLTTCSISVAEVAVVGVPDDRLGERVCAFVVLRPGRTLDLPGLTRHFAELGVARQKVPERLEFAGTLPRTGLGKVRKRELRKLIHED